MDEEENNYRNTKEVNTTKIISIVDQLNSIASNSNSNKHVITTDRFIKSIITEAKKLK